MRFTMNVDANYLEQLQKKLKGKHDKKFADCSVNFKTAMRSVKWWYKQLPDINCHPADLNPKTGARYYLASAYIYEIFRYLKSINKLQYAVDNFDLEDILKVEFLHEV